MSEADWIELPGRRYAVRPEARGMIPTNIEDDRGYSICWDVTNRLWALWNPRLQLWEEADFVPDDPPPGHTHYRAAADACTLPRYPTCKMQERTSNYRTHVQRGGLDDEW